MNRRQFLAGTLAALLGMAITHRGEVSAAVSLYVAPSGNDQCSGRLAAANAAKSDGPLATIQAAVNQLRPGDTLWIHGGVYRETVTFPRNGTAQNPITIKACKGEKVVRRLEITKPGVYENLIVDGGFAHGSRVKIRADNVTLRNCEIRNGGRELGIGEGQAVVLKFKLNQAKIFSLDFE